MVGIGTVGSTSVHENTSSVSSTNSIPVIPEIIMSETDSNNEPGSNSESGSNEEETNYDGSESSSSNLTNVENERKHNKEDDEIEEEEEEKSERSLSELEEKSNLEKLLAIQESYELYCPRCSLCITRGVILKERKRGEESDVSVNLKPNVEGHLDAINTSDTTESPPQNKPDQGRFGVELLKSTVYGGLTETITSLIVVSSASASGSSTLNILALVVANLAGGLMILAQNLHDLRSNLDEEKDRYEELLGKRANFRAHILVTVLSYILFGLIPPLVYAFSFYETGIKYYKLVLVFSVSLVCVILLGMIKVYVRKPPNVRESTKAYIKSAAYYTSVVVASSGISYFVGDMMGEYLRKLGWFSLNQDGLTSHFDGIKSEEYRFASF